MLQHHYHPHCETGAMAPHVQFHSQGHFWKWAQISATLRSAYFQRLYVSEKRLIGSHLWSLIIYRTVEKQILWILWNSWETETILWSGHPKNIYDTRNLVCYFGAHEQLTFEGSKRTKALVLQICFGGQSLQFRVALFFNKWPYFSKKITVLRTDFYPPPVQLSSPESTGGGVPPNTWPPKIRI